ncbi:hypothetical protein FOZ60_010716 [Perkinsus olseni]|uniref:Uncharacterized protein n=1 Tax=Perkinsus olseni TaxID=32597 RepID=A0A7J6PCN3_PEROL|nr:hypothetical protein FOZ60_010716 [Perkinsus olseni]
MEAWVSNMADGFERFKGDMVRISQDAAEGFERFKRGLVRHCVHMADGFERFKKAVITNLCLANTFGSDLRFGFFFGQRVLSLVPGIGSSVTDAAVITIAVSLDRYSINIHWWACVVLPAT